jgi:hypothetical protein
MHKGIHIAIKLWIEGEDEPAHDFTESTIKAVKEMLKTSQMLHPELQVKVKSVEEDTRWDENENS